MTNILDYWDDVKGKAPDLSQPAVNDLLVARSKTAYGFFEREERFGIIALRLPLSDSKAQDSYRLLVYRFLEEFLESHLAEDQNHIREEAIDAFNYLLAIPLIEGEIIEGQVWSPLMSLMATEVFLRAASEQAPWGQMKQVDATMVYTATALLLGQVSPALRNRAWMEETQNAYMNYAPLISAFRILFDMIFSLFDSWEMFWEYYTAKDMVLQFRLRSNY